MSFKYFSGDFVALYNAALAQYAAEQLTIDKKFGAIIDELAEGESLRLENIFPRPFMSGDRVETIDGRIGEVIDCPVALEFKHDCEYGWELMGPARYLPLKSTADEVVATCEGMIRKVVVKFKANEIELDWGNDEVVSSFYPDELSIIKKV